MKRFYKTATIAPDNGAYAVQLDGRSVKTPHANPLLLPTPALAELPQNVHPWLHPSDTRRYA